MEKYMTNLRIILCANSTSRLIAPIKSRCLLIRVAAPNREEMLFVLNHVAKRAGAGLLPEDAADEIITDANGNLRKAILVFEAMKMQSYADPYAPALADPTHGT
jgi:replication factor C subunit 3/5